MRKLLLIIFFFINFCLIGYGQNNYILKTANRFFEQHNYTEAINFYEKLVANDGATSESLKKQAISYLKIKKTGKAEHVLENLVSKYPLTEESAFLYASALASNGRYEQANLYYRKTLEINPTNGLAKQMVADYESLPKLFSDSSSYRLFYLNLNTHNSEFSPVYYHSKLLFVSARKKVYGVKHVYQYNDSPFLDLYLIDTTKLTRKKLSNSPTIYPKEEIIAQKKLHEGITKETSNDNAVAGSYHADYKNENFQLLDEQYGILPFNKKLATAYHEGPSIFTTKLDTLYFTSNNTEQRKSSKKFNTLKIYSATLNKNGEFSNPTPLPFCSDTYSVAHPALSMDGNTLYFSSNMPGGKGGMDLYMVKRSNGKWSTPIPLNEINTQGNELFPYVDSMNQLFYSSDGKGGLGGLDIFVVRTDDYSSSFNPGFPLNSSKDDFGVLFNSNNTSGYISSNRKENGADDNLYYFTCSKPLVVEKKILPPKDTSLISFKGKLKEKTSKKSIQTMVAFFEESEKNLINIVYSDEFGNFSTDLVRNKNYILKIADAQYYILTDSFDTNIDIRVLEKQYELEPNIAVTNGDSIKNSWQPYVSNSTIHGKVVDALTNEPLDAIIKISSTSDTSNVFMTISDFDGVFSSSIPNEGQYSIEVVMEGYLYSTTLIEINKNTSKELLFPLSKIKNEYDSLQKIWVHKKMKGTLKGSVYAEPNNEPLSNIIALFEEGDSLLQEYSISDFDGKFEMKIKKGVNYSLLVQDPERGEIHKKIILPETDTIIHVVLSYKASSSPDKVNLDSVIKVYAQQDREHNTQYGATVIDKDTKEPLDALIAIQTNPEGAPDEVTASDFEGKFSFKLRKHKSYYLTFVSKEYDTYSLSVNLDDSLTLPTIIPLSKLKDNKKTDSLLVVYTAKLKEKSTLLGTVTTLVENEPVMAFVALFKEGETIPYEVVPSDESGKFSFSLKKNSFYKIEIMETGYLPIQDYLNTTDTSILFRRDYKLKQPIKKEVYDSLTTTWKEKSTLLLQEKKLSTTNELTAIKGYVFEVETNAPLVTNISLVNPTDNILLDDTISLPTGKYSFITPSDASYKLIYESEGHYTDSMVIKATPATKSRQSIFFLKKAPIQKTRNEGSRIVQLSGTIKDAQTKAPVSATIGLSKEGQSELVEVINCDKDGNYSIELPGNSNYSLKIVDSNYAVLTDLIKLKASTSKIFVRNYELIKENLASKSDSISKSFEKYLPSFKLVGKVIDSSNSNPIQAIIKITQVSNATDFLTISNEQGIVSAGLSAKGAYKIEILREGYQYFATTFDLMSDSIALVFRLVKIHQEYKEIKELMSKKLKGRFEGTITEVPSDPLTGFILVCELGDTILTKYTISNFEGKFSIPLKKETTYNILIQDTKYGDKLDQIVIPSSDSVLVRNYQFQKSDKIRRINFDSLAKAYYAENKLHNTDLYATLLDSKTLKPVDAYIAIQEATHTIPDEATISDSYGNFNFHIRKHKPYFLTIVGENYHTKIIRIHSDSSMPNRIVLDRLPKSAVIDSLLLIYKNQFAEKPLLTGTIKEAASNEPLMALIAVYKNNGKVPYVVYPSDFDGTFSIPLKESGTYSIQVVEPGYVPVVRQLSLKEITKLTPVNILLSKYTTGSKQNSILNNWKEQKAQLTAKLKNQPLIGTNTKNRQAATVTNIQLETLDATSPKRMYGILFEVNEATITSKQYPYLKTLVSSLTSDTTIKVYITGHADYSGSDSLNLLLSLKRAQTVKEYLISKSIKSSRISISGKGERETLVTNTSSFGKQINRRVEYTLSGDVNPSIYVQTGYNIIFSSIQEGINGVSCKKTASAIEELFKQDTLCNVEVEITSSNLKLNEVMATQLNRSIDSNKSNCIHYTSIVNNTITKDKIKIELFIRK